MPKKGRPYFGFSDSLRQLEVGQVAKHNYDMTNKKHNDIVRQIKKRISDETGYEFKAFYKHVKRIK